jgi:hypothetical protein
VALEIPLGQRLSAASGEFSETPLNRSIVLMIDLTLTLPTDICELAKNNDGARADVFATSPTISSTQHSCL